MKQTPCLFLFRHCSTARKHIDASDKKLSYPRNTLSLPLTPKMGKKVKEYKSGDFIFAKVKGYPAWPARVQKLNGKKYFVYFYGTGETANLAPNMIFDYAENKDKFLTKTVKRRDFNDGVKQIEYDFANNIPLEQVIGVPMEVAEGVNDTANDSAIDATMDESAADTTANDTMANNTVGNDTNATQDDAAVEDSDEAGALVIDEGKAPKGKKTKADPQTTKGKEPKTPRGKAKKEEAKNREQEKADEELVSRSGRKIRPKRYIDEQTEENATLPSPLPKRRRGASPVVEKEKVVESAKEKEASKSEKTFTQFNTVKQSELEGLKEPFKPADEEKDNILIAYLPSGAYVGIKLFQSRPNSFKNEAARLQWDKQAAANAITLKMQLERDQITPQSIQAQLIMDLNLTDEEKATLDKERETEEKKSRVNFLKTEMKLIELDAKIKTCLCLEKADTEHCLKLLDELLALEVKPLMLLKHPTCLETVKRMRAYVGNTPSWDLSESAALVFSKQAHKIRKKADMLYKNMKEHFQTPDGLSFWEYFSERVLVFKKVTSNLNAGELLEMVHEPIELSQPYAHTMRSAIDQANNTVPPLPETPEIEEEEKQFKKKGSAGKTKKPAANSSPSKSKRSSRSKKDEEDSSEHQKAAEETSEVEKITEGDKNSEVGDKEKNQDAENVSEESIKDAEQDPENTPKETEDVDMAEADKPPEKEQSTTNTEKDTEEAQESESSEKSKEPEKSPKESKDKNKEADKPSKEEKSSKKDKKVKEDKSEKSSKDEDSEKDSDKSAKDSDKNAKASDKIPSKSSKEDKHSRDEKSGKDRKNSKDERSSKDSSKNGKDNGKDKDDKSDDKAEGKDDKSDDKEKQDSGEPRAKRSRDSKKTEPPPPRSPAKRKSKF